MFEQVSKIRHEIKPALYPILAFPIIVFIPTLTEALQHIVEFKLGMFTSWDLFRESQGNALRMTTGSLKAFIFVLIALIIMPRFAMHGSLFSDTKERDLVAAKLLAKVLVISSLLIIVGIIILSALKLYLPQNYHAIPIHFKLLIIFAPLLFVSLVAEKELLRGFSIIYSSPDTISREMSQKNSRGFNLIHTGLVFVVGVPFIYAHIQLHHIAVALSGWHSVFVLIVDSFLIGCLSAFCGTATILSYQIATTSKREAVLAL